MAPSIEAKRKRRRAIIMVAAGIPAARVSEKTGYDESYLANLRRDSGPEIQALYDDPEALEAAMQAEHRLDAAVRLGDLLDAFGPPTTETAARDIDALTRAIKNLDQIKPKSGTSGKSPKSPDSPAKPKL